MELDELIDVLQKIKNSKNNGKIPVFVKVNGGAKEVVTQAQLSGPVAQIKGSENFPLEIILVAGDDQGLRAVVSR